MRFYLSYERIYILLLCFEITGETLPSVEDEQIQLCQKLILNWPYQRNGDWWSSVTVLVLDAPRPVLPLTLANSTDAYLSQRASDEAVNPSDQLIVFLPSANLNDLSPPPRLFCLFDTLLRLSGPIKVVNVTRWPKKWLSTKRLSTMRPFMK